MVVPNLITKILASVNDTTTCLIDRITYKAGERLYPKKSCYACICQKGFNGKFEEPYCKRSGCDSQLKFQSEIQNFCAPLYLKRDGEKKCCPTTWTCRNTFSTRYFLT